MFVSAVESVPLWVTQALWTLATIVGALLVGWLIRWIAGARLTKLAARTSGDWDDILLGQIGRRIPFWSLLIGLHLSQARWPLSGTAHLQAARWLSAIGVASVTFAAAAILTRLVVSYWPRAAAPVSGLTLNLVRIIVTVVGGLVIIKSFDYDITPMLTVLGVGGLTVALALQEPLSNLFAGLFVSLAGQVRIGDYVRLDSGAEGHVIDFNWRSTRVRQLADNIVEIPNSKLAQAIVTNYSQPSDEMAMAVEFTVHWSNDLALVERLAAEAAQSVVLEVPGAVARSTPVVRFQVLSEVGVRLTVAVRVQTFRDQALVRHELIKRVHARFAEHHVG